MSPARTKTHCLRGHSLSGENVVLVRRGRWCRTCKQLLQKKYNQAKNRRVRFAAKVVARRLANFSPVPESGCWLWMGAWDQDGYGLILSGGRYRSRAHRYFYRMNVGPIPDGMLVLHKCDTPLCVNPAHLFLGTNADNMADKKRKGRGRGRYSKPKGA